jgi:hypothetical protein
MVHNRTQTNNPHVIRNLIVDRVMVQRGSIARERSWKEWTDTPKRRDRIVTNWDERMICTERPVVEGKEVLWCARCA